jgi:hypothetical protein
MAMSMRAAPGWLALLLLPTAEGAESDSEEIGGENQRPLRLFSNQKHIE